MARITNWPRVFWRSTTDEQVQREIEATGSAEIAKWRHEGSDITCAHVYEPGAKKPYVVELRNTDLNPAETGRYATRAEGGEANKQLMRKNADLGSRSGGDPPAVDIRTEGEDWLRQRREENSTSEPTE